MPEWIVTKSSPRSVPETVQRMSELAAAKGLKLFTVIDHSGEAAAHGLELRDTKVVVFGSPVAGTPVMQAAPLAALDLPLKVLVWDDDGQTRVSYTAPSELGARYGLSDELAARLAGIDGLTDAPRPASSDLDRLNVDGLGALVAGLGVVRHLCALGKRAVAVRDDRSVMNEQVLRVVVGRDEAKALLVAEPLHGSSSH
jgi:uncharacterized protein (DUF302 family)